MPPALVFYDSVDEYKRHYKREYCAAKIYTHDNIRVFFRQEKFNHAFYKGQRKQDFAKERAERIDWIKAALVSTSSIQYKGYHEDEGVLDYRRTSLFYEGYVVILQMRLAKDNELVADFVTAWPASKKSKAKIQTSPIWSYDDCVNYLRNKKSR